MLVIFFKKIVPQSLLFKCYKLNMAIGEEFYKAAIFMSGP